LGIVAASQPRRVDPWVSARRRSFASVVAGVITGAASGLVTAWQVSALIGWCTGAAVFVGYAWAAMLTADSQRTRAIAMREDETRVTSDLVVLAACIASLVGVALILLKASQEHGASAAGMTALGVTSVVIAWVTVQTVFTLRYADLYYSHEGGIDFNEQDAPDYRDFAYLAFTIGMTYQVSDTDLTTKEVRRTALKHALFSYLFGTAIIAVMINVVAGLAH
jgi:uncharacterized membrane protein